MFKQSHRHVYTTENVLRPSWSSQTHTYRRGEAAGSEKSADPLAIDPVRSLAVEAQGTHKYFALITPDALVSPLQVTLPL